MLPFEKPVIGPWRCSKPPFLLVEKTLPSAALTRPGRGRRAGVRGALKRRPQPSLGPASSFTSGVNAASLFTCRKPGLIQLCHEVPAPAPRGCAEGVAAQRPGHPQAALLVSVSSDKPRRRSAGLGRASLASAATEGVPGPCGPASQRGRAGREHAGLCAAQRDLDAEDAAEETAAPREVLGNSGRRRTRLASPVSAPTGVRSRKLLSGGHPRPRDA